MDVPEPPSPSSAENERAVREFYAAMYRQDVSACLAFMAEDVEVTFYGPREIPFAGTYLGHSQVAYFLHKLFDVAEPLRFEPYEFNATSTRVLVHGHEQIRAKPTGRVWECSWSHVIYLREGQIVRMREQHDVAVIAEAYRSDKQ